MNAIARGHKIGLVTAIFAGFALLGANPALAQAPSGPIAPKPGQPIQRPPQGTPQKPPDQSIRVRVNRSEEHTSELQSLTNLVCRLLLEKKKRRKAKHS